MRRKIASVLLVVLALAVEVTFVPSMQLKIILWSMVGGGGIFLLATSAPIRKHLGFRSPVFRRSLPPRPEVLGVSARPDSMPLVPRSPVEAARRQLSQGMRLRTRLVAEAAAAADPDREASAAGRELQADPLYRWAQTSWSVLAEHFPEYADDFYGEDPELGSGYFALNFSVETMQRPREEYLRTRLELLRRVLGEAVQAPPIAA